MKVVIAPDSFKGGMSAREFCHSVEAGLRHANPNVVCIHKPMADGGEGTAAALLAARPGGQWLAARVAGPLPGRWVNAGYAWFPDDRTAVIEMAAASGLPLLATHEYNPLLTTTFGTGQLIQAAVQRNAKHILLTIGGSATVDGGVGAATAAGWRFLNANGGIVPPGGGHLLDIARIVKPDIQCLPPMTVLCDVTNPLCGPQGAAAVFGPQKGATAAMVELLDAGLSNLADCIRNDLGRDVRALQGAGAAGGLGAGAVAFFDAAVAPGIATVVDASGLREALAGADWCITGEGSFDSQSFNGKVVSGVVEAARANGVPVAVFAGQVHVEASVCRANGVCSALALQTCGMPLSESLELSTELLYKTAVHWMQNLKVQTSRHSG